MKLAFTSILSFSFALGTFAQTPALPNGTFDSWGGNTIPPSTSTAQPNEPNGWYSNQSGSSLAQAGPQTCYQDGTIKHSGANAVRLETKSIVILGSTIVVNGSLTTGVINAPTTNKADGYIGTWNHTSPTTDVRRVAFNGRPDSLVGWYQYTQGGPNEIGKVKAILHVGQYFDPPTPANSNHPDSSMNGIGIAKFNTPASNVGTWTRFAVAFTYSDARTPAYIMVNATSSDNQVTTVAGSKMWLDDLAVVYNSTAGVNQANANTGIQVNYFNKTLYVDFLNRSAGKSDIEVYNAAGQVIAKKSLDNNQLNSIGLPGLASEVYFYKIIGSGYSRSGKFFVD